MKKLLKRKWLLGGAILALVLLVIGIAVPVLAASGNSNANSYGNSYIDGPTMTRLASVLGLTPADLSTQLQSGKTLATLAQEHNVTITALQDAIIAPYADQVASQVKYSYVTQDQADTLLANARNSAGSLIQQNLSVQSGNTGNNGYPGNCYNYMTANGYGPGTARGGFMGPGMMWGWGNSNNSANGSNNSSPGVPQNSGPGAGGWIGGGMMGRR